MKTKKRVEESYNVRFQLIGFDRTIPEFAKSLRDLADVLERASASDWMDVPSFWSDTTYKEFGLKLEGNVDPLHFIIEASRKIGDVEYKTETNSFLTIGTAYCRNDEADDGVTYIEINPSTVQMLKEPGITINEMLRRFAHCEDEPELKRFVEKRHYDR